MNIKKLVLSAFALAICLFANAQKEIPDSATELLFDKQGALTRVVATEEEAKFKIIEQNPLLDDVPWRKVVLRVVDLREEQNKPLYYPYENINEETQKNLFAILFYNFLTGKLVGYKDDGVPDQTFVPSFKKENEIRASDTTKYAHAHDEYFEGMEDDPYQMINQITQSCVKYYIQEAWYFDKHTSTFHSKILAIAPIFDPKYNNQILAAYPEDVKPSSVWFWFPYDKVRPFLQQEYIKMSGRNTKQLLNFDDFFTQRQFYSYIIKDYDLTEKDIDNAIYLDDTDPQKVIRIQEQQAKIEAEILDFEQDLWNY